MMNPLHSWNVSVELAIQIQEALKDRIILKKTFSKVETIGGGDVAYSRDENLLFGAIAVLSFPNLEILDMATADGKVPFPYIPTLLSFREGPMGEILGSIASRYGFPLHWHPGFTLAVDQVPDNFRGYAVRPLAVRIAGIGILDAAKIGEAANSLWRDPESWKDWGSFDESLTRFRRLWHVMVLYGLPNPAAHFRTHLVGG